MPKRIAALVCCLTVVSSSLVTAQTVVNERRTIFDRRAATDAYDGPLRRASLTQPPAALRADAVSARSKASDPQGSWMERHPVIAGALVGFGIGVGFTYLAAGDDREEVFTPISTGAAALFWGGVSAGVGALAGWGVGRNREKPPEQVNGTR
jgi:hypothetical protein